MIRTIFAPLACTLLLSVTACKESPCRAVSFEENALTVCSFAAQDDELSFHRLDPDGTPFGQFENLASHLEDNGRDMIFAMNGGMYHDDRSPVGLYVEQGERTGPLVVRASAGNFGMLPNGLFWIDEDGIGVTETLAYIEQFEDTLPTYATQSGPMLVIDGELHPDFNADGPSKKRRNGVGVSADGQEVHFVISDAPINFHQFASFFKDELGTPNALFLDGTVSKLYAPSIGRNEKGFDMGPIIAVSVPQNRK
ncbi:MAG: phosphodiester glycosidase family protein [Hyphomonas sp.]